MQRLSPKKTAARAARAVANDVPFLAHPVLLALSALLISTTLTACKDEKSMMIIDPTTEAPVETKEQKIVDAMNADAFLRTIKTARVILSENPLYESRWMTPYKDLVEKKKKHQRVARLGLILEIDEYQDGILRSVHFCSEPMNSNTDTKSLYFSQFNSINSLWGECVEELDAESTDSKVLSKFAPFTVKGECETSKCNQVKLTLTPSEDSQFKGEKQVVVQHSRLDQMQSQGFIIDEQTDGIDDYVIGHFIDEEKTFVKSETSMSYTTIDRTLYERTEFQRNFQPNLEEILKAQEIDHQDAKDANSIQSEIDYLVNTDVLKEGEELKVDIEAMGSFFRGFSMYTFTRSVLGVESKRAFDAKYEPNNSFTSFGSGTMEKMDIGLRLNSNSGILALDVAVTQNRHWKEETGRMTLRFSHPDLQSKKANNNKAIKADEDAFNETSFVELLTTKNSKEQKAK